MATDNDPKLKVRAYALAAQFDSQPIKWRVDPDGAFVLILVDGRKMKFDSDQSETETTTATIPLETPTAEKPIKTKSKKEKTNA
jgi:hypothetical protein